jgi:NADH:ubiquinone oxidoreductase subunit F (NADH-binding)
MGRGDGRQPWCKPCRKDYDREYHARNRARRQEQVKERRRRLHEWNNRIKSSTPCADCGRTFHPVAMTWDHLPGTDKVTEVSNLVRAGKTIQARKEIEKCEVVCANCHAVRSYERRNGA